MNGSGGPTAPRAWGAAFERVRASARRRAEELGPPTTALEDWRYVQLVPPGPLDPVSGAVAGQVGQQLPRRAGRIPVVLVDGVMHPASAYGPAGGIAAAGPLELTDLYQLPAAAGEALAERWQAQLGADRDISRAWTLAELRGGLCIRVRGEHPAPLDLLLLSTGGTSGCAIEIELERGASARLQLHHAAEGASCARLSMALSLAADSQLSIVEVQAGPAAERSQLITVSSASLARDARLTWLAVRRGLQLGRGRIDVELTGTGAAFDLAMVADLPARRQWHDLTRVDHRVGETASAQLVKTIADGGAIGSYDGLVRIHAGADGADARQRHQSLLLHPKGRVDSRPQLDIAADEVKAGHGSSIGHLAADELFYLRARGLGEAEARALLVQGFALDILSRLPPELREELPGAGTGSSIGEAITR